MLFSQAKCIEYTLMLLDTLVHFNKHGFTPFT